MQWDSTDIARTMSPLRIEGIKNAYRNKGYDIVTVGGEALTEELKSSIHHIGYAMSQADYHVGADSGMMHIAQYYKRYDQIHLHNAGFKSHHLYRAIKNGSKINWIP